MRSLLIIVITGKILCSGYIFSQYIKVFESNYDKKVITGYPQIYYQFKETKDTTLYNASVKEIRVYQQYTKPFINNERILYVNPSLQFARIDELVKKHKLNIQALKYYIDTSTFVSNTEKTWATVQTFIPYHQLYSPFYILKTEVTNKEYNEFIAYVRDSIARTLLGNGISKLAPNFCSHDSDGKMHIKWDKPIPWNSDNDDVRSDLKPLYIPDEEKFYNRKEIDARKLNYEYNYHPSGVEEYNYYKDIVNVYPDTLCWVHDFVFSDILSVDLEAYTNMYHWHLAYDDYPVVGLGFAQIRAFLHWKTEVLQKQLDKKGIKFRIECDLPTEIEWETVNSADLINNSIRYYNTFSSYDNNMLPDLYYKCNSAIKIDTGRLDKSITKKSTVLVGNNTGIFAKDSIIEGHVFDYVHYTTTIEQQKLNEYALRNRKFTSSTRIQPTNNKQSFAETSNGIIYNTHNNVSEWMREVYFEADTNYASYKYLKKKSLQFYSSPMADNDTEFFPYDGNYKNILGLYIKLLKQYNLPYMKEYANKLEETVKPYNKSYRLVRGANWYDRGSVLNGDEKKTFIAGDSAHATVGFRYVVRFKEKK